MTVRPVTMQHEAHMADDTECVFECVATFACVNVQAAFRADTFVLGICVPAYGCGVKVKIRC